MAEPENVKKVTRMMSDLEIIQGTQYPVVPIATMVDCPRRDLRDQFGEPIKRYKWVMRRHYPSNFPSMALDSNDIQEESVYTVADEVWRSHIFNARLAMEATSLTFIVWLDFDFFRIKDHPDTVKMSCEKLNLEEGKGVKTRQYHYLQNGGVNLALSPSIQCLKFEQDEFIRRHGLALKTGRFSFAKEVDQEIRYIEMKAELCMEEPFRTLEIEYFTTPTQLMVEESKKRKREEEARDKLMELPEVWGDAMKK